MGAAASDFPHNVPTLAIAVVVLAAARNKLEFLLPLVPELRKVLEEVKPGEVRRGSA